MSEPDAGRLSLVYHYPSPNAASATTAAAVPDAPNVVWRATGYKAFGEEGWRRVRVPLPAFNVPVSVSYIF